jgi:hypothetical protein
MDMQSSVRKILGLNHEGRWQASRTEVDFPSAMIGFPSLMISYNFSSQK